MLIEELKNKKIAILGFGKEGRSTLDFLMGIGAKDITVLDKNLIDLDEEQYPNVLEISGGFYLDNLDAFDVIIKSPGISPYHLKILPHRKILTSQTEIFFSNYSGKVIGVTATKGKTTIVSILAQTLQNAGYTVKLVGNIGHPVLSEIPLSALQASFPQEEKEVIYDYIVYELSSYMLENFAPKLYIGVLGNIFPDHLDWHNNDFEIYEQAKLNILKNAEYKIDGREILADSNNILQKIETPLLGDHNIRNISLVWKICEIIGVEKNILLENVKTFKAITHRLEKVSEKKGIIFIDDAISTTPESTIEAIKTFGESIGVIFLGGLDRGGYNFEELVKSLIKYNITNIVLFPETGKKMLPILNKEGVRGWSILETSSMKKAVEFAFKNCKKGEVCLLSTASPSYNLYRDYIAQGEDFKEEINLFDI